MPEFPATARNLLRRWKAFEGSQAYWEHRYAVGGTSGPGSYGDFAVAKAAVVNGWISQYRISSVVEFGCGDGNQLTLLDVPDYVGLDVSPTAIRGCIERFEQDSTKSFFVYAPKEYADRTGVFRRDAALSQEVLFHLVERDVFDRYMRHLFAAADRFVIICAADIDWAAGAHELHRKFTPWIDQHATEWRLIEKAPSPMPYDESTDTGLLSEFFLYGR